MAARIAPKATSSCVVKCMCNAEFNSIRRRVISTSCDRHPSVFKGVGLVARNSARTVRCGGRMRILSCDSLAEYTRTSASPFQHRAEHCACVALSLCASKVDARRAAPFSELIISNEICNEPNISDGQLYESRLLRLLNRSKHIHTYPNRGSSIKEI